jgi:hypothetical protein
MVKNTRYAEWFAREIKGVRALQEA